MTTLNPFEAVEVKYRLSTAAYIDGSSGDDNGNSREADSKFKDNASDNGDNECVTWRSFRSGVYIFMIFVAVFFFLKIWH